MIRTRSLFQKNNRKDSLCSGYIRVYNHGDHVSSDLCHENHEGLRVCHDNKRAAGLRTIRDRLCVDNLYWGCFFALLWFSDTAPYRVEVMNFEDLPSEGLRFVFERNHCSLLERLPIDRVLAAGKFRLPEDCLEEERKYVDEQIENSGTDFYRRYEESIENIIDEQIDSPLMQIQPIPVTDEILYSYDFGDNWKIRITASENCADLVEAGRITQAELDRANVKCREVYRPVLIARDGEMLIDDVGGIHGFAEFLQMVNPELSGLDPEEKEEARQEKKRYLEWAKSLGWHREKSTDFNLL